MNGKFMIKWFENKLIIWFLKRYSKLIRNPMIISKPHKSGEWYMIDGYGTRYTLKETADYYGQSPLIITIEEK